MVVIHDLLLDSLWKNIVKYVIICDHKPYSTISID